jgi:hypothetical protein
MGTKSRNPVRLADEYIEPAKRTSATAGRVMRLA